jgi:hypothetical protein
MPPKTLSEQAQSASANGHADIVDADLAGLTFRPIGKLRLNEIVEIEKQTGRKCAADLAGDFGADFLIGMLWLELRKIHPTVTYEQAGEHAVEDTLEAILRALADENEPEPDPPTGPGGSPGPEAATSTVTGSSSRRPSASSTRSSATSTG